jgi:hypothetical protein
MGPGAMSTGLLETFAGAGELFARVEFSAGRGYIMSVKSARMVIKRSVIKRQVIK